MSAEANKAIVRRFYEGFHTPIEDELIAPDYLHHDPALPPEMQRGLANYKLLLGAFRAGFPDLAMAVEEVVAEGDLVASRWTWRGTHRGDFQGIPPTGRRVEGPGMSIHRIAGGKIAEGWVNFDALGMLQQLGVVPAPGQSEAAATA